MIKFLINRFLLKEQNVNDVIHLINLPVRKDSPILVVLVSNLVTRADLIETLKTANSPLPVFHWKPLFPLSQAPPRTKGWRIYPTYEQSVKNKLHLMTSPKGIGSKLPVNKRKVIENRKFSGTRKLHPNYLKFSWRQGCRQAGRSCTKVKAGGVNILGSCIQGHPLLLRHWWSFDLNGSLSLSTRWNSYGPLCHVNLGEKIPPPLSMLLDQAVSEAGNCKGSTRIFMRVPACSMAYTCFQAM